MRHDGNGRQTDNSKKRVEIEDLRNELESDKRIFNYERSNDMDRLS